MLCAALSLIQGRVVKKLKQSGLGPTRNMDVLRKAYVLEVVENTVQSFTSTF